MKKNIKEVLFVIGFISGDEVGFLRSNENNKRLTYYTAT